MSIIKKLASVLLAGAVMLSVLPFGASADAAWDPQSGTMDVYELVAGKNNGGNTKYTNYRIPGIVVTKNDTVIVYWEVRMSGSDWADMDILAMRSEDGGKTFGEPIIIASGAESGATMNNPVMIVGNDGLLHILYCVEYGVCKTCNDAATSKCTHGPGVFHAISRDDGKTWSEPKNISDSTFSTSVDHDVIAVGPGHGIAMSDGTLLASVWLVEPQNNTGGLTSHHAGSVSTIYSKDNGETWQIGEIVPNDDTDGSAVKDPNETMPVETSDGGVMLNIRSGGGGYRALAWSPNGYSDWTTMEYDKNLIDPTCMGSVTKYDIEGDPYTILLVNCESTSGRSNLVLKASVDDGKSWTYRKVIDPGVAGYSDVAVDSKGTIYILYEVNAGVTCNLARLSYDSYVAESEIVPPPKVADNSLVMHLNGESFKDATGNLNDVAINTDVKLNTEKSAFGQGSYEYNGNSGDTSRMVVTPTNGMYVEDKDFTFTAWINPDSTTSSNNNQQILFWYGSSGAGKPQIWCRTRGTDLQCNIASGGVETTLTATGVIKTGVWNHVAVVREGVSHYLYLNGEIVASKQSDFVHNINGEDRLTIGINHSMTTPNRVIDGCIDEIMMFNYALNQEELDSVYKTNALPYNNPFTDVKDDSEYAKAVAFVTEAGLFNGTSETTFSPEMTMTRSMFVTVLGRLDGIDTGKYVNPTFRDVVRGQWYTAYVEWAAANGVVNGIGDGLYGINESVTVEQALTILSRYNGLRQGNPTGKTAASFSDGGSVSAWAKDGVEWAVANGIYGGTDGMLAPTSPASRAAVAMMFYNYVNVYGK